MAQPVEIKRFQNRMQAEIAAGVLEGCGIECEIWADDLMANADY